MLGSILFYLTNQFWALLLYLFSLCQCGRWEQYLICTCISEWKWVCFFKYLYFFVSPIYYPFSYWVNHFLFSFLAVQGSELGTFHLSHTPNPFAFSYFFSILALDHDPFTSVSWVRGITDMYHHPWLVFWERVSPTFCLDWSWTAIPLSGITEMSFFFFF
jgi:hypothetical protein